MDSVVKVENLKKYYQVHKKEPGFTGSLKSLFKREYFDVKAVDDITFEIHEGELIGFIGPNGAGKTTTLKMLSGLIYPTSGFVQVLGHIPYKRESTFQKQFALVMGQKNQLWWDIPAWETFVLQKEIYGVSDKQFKEVVSSLSQLLEIEDILKVQVRKLSLGQRMKAELVAALLHSPKVLFLDEPTIGLDVVAQQKMREFIRDYNQKYGATIILTSHYMEDVKELCKRVIIIDHGVIIYDGQLSKITEQYAPYKVIEVVFDSERGQKVDKEKLERLGAVVEYDGIKAKVHVPRAEATKRAGELLNHFPVVDLNIQDPPIEEVITTIFTGHR